MMIEITCPFCGATHFVVCSAEGFEAWQNGELVQNVFPELTSTEREQLISQLCPQCQESIFGS